jgi:hypothetical protein
MVPPWFATPDADETPVGAPGGQSQVHFTRLPRVREPSTDADRRRFRVGGGIEQLGVVEVGLFNGPAATEGAI